MTAAAQGRTAAKPMRRLLRVLELEEEQAERALAAATAELRQIENARAVAHERERRGRALVAASVASGQVADRISGLEETRLGRRSAVALVPRIAEADVKVAARRKEFLAKRVERRQAETLVHAAEARAAREASQREQQTMDEWFLSGKLRARQGERARSGEEYELLDGEAAEAKAGR